MWTRTSRATFAGLAALVWIAALHGASRGEDPLRVAAMTTVLLGLPVFLAAGIVALLDRREPAASAVAAAFLLFLFADYGTQLHSRFHLFTLRPRGLPNLAALAVGAAIGFLALRFVLAGLRARVPPVSRRPAARLAVALAVLAGAAGLVPRGGPAPFEGPAPAGKPNILLVTIETLRADHLSIYGYTVHRTPSLDRLAGEGLFFTSAYSTAPWTLASLSSVMTGYLPSVVGIERRETGLPADLPTLAETLRKEGYDTHAVITNTFTTRKYGLGRGFRLYDHLDDLGIYLDLARHPIYRLAQKVKLKLVGDNADRLTNRTLAWLQSGRDPSRPFFLWLHYMDPHEPYGGPQIRDDLPCGAKEAPHIGYFFADHRRVFRGERKLSDAERAHLVHLYDAEIRFLDRHFGRLLGFLGESGLEKSTLLVVTADHGEELWDHGGFEHGHSVHDEVVHVPLFLRWPGVIRAGSRRDAPASLLALMPTLLAAAGTAPLETQSGALPLDAPDAPDAAAVSENLFFGPERKAIRSADTTVILDPESGETRVFDRRTDPTEQHPLETAQGEPLQRVLAAWIERSETLHGRFAGRSTRVPLSDFEKEQLRALGYVD